MTEAETQDALHRLDPLWEQLFPAEQGRIVRSLVERVVVGPTGADIRLRVEGLHGLVRDLGAIAPDTLRSAALRRQPASRSECRWRSATGLGGRPS